MPDSVEWAEEKKAPNKRIKIVIDVLEVGIKGIKGTIESVLEDGSCIANFDNGIRARVYSEEYRIIRKLHKCSGNIECKNTVHKKNQLCSRCSQQSHIDFWNL